MICLALLARYEKLTSRLGQMNSGLTRQGSRQWWSTGSALGIAKSGDVHGGLGESGFLLELLPFPAGLWSRDRRSCCFDTDTRRLLGYSESDFLRKTILWMDRVHPQDRDGFVNAWRRIEGGEKSTSCFRF